MKLPDMDQKLCIASRASGNESRGGGRDPSDSVRECLSSKVTRLPLAEWRRLFCTEFAGRRGQSAGQGT